MSYLNKSDVFFERDDNGNLLGVDVVLETIPDKPTIKVIPMAKGKLAKIMSQATGNETDKDTDIDIIIEHCVEPKFTEEDRDALKNASKTAMVNAIVVAVFSLSTNTSQTKIVEDGKKAAVEKELSDFQKR